MQKEIQLLQDLVAIPSVSCEEQAAVEFLVSEAKQLNFDEVYADEVGNFVAVRGAGPEVVLMLSHIDTVPGEVPVRIEDGNLYGRGSVDAKGSLLSFLWAAHHAELPEGRRVIVVGAVEEEVSTSKGARAVLGRWDPNIILIGEPSGCSNITLGYKGGFRFRYDFERELTHYSSGEKTAADYGVDFVNLLRERVPTFAPAGETVFYQPTLEIRSFKTDYDGITERVRVCCNVRVPLEFDAEGFAEFLKDYPVTLEECIPAHLGTKNNRLVRALVRGIREQGGTPRFLKKTGTADFNILGPYYPDVPIVAYGPGDSHLDHTPHEHLDLAEYEQAIQILKSVLESAL